MEIIVVSPRLSHTGGVLQSIDSSLKYHNAELVSLHPTLPKTLEQVNALIECDRFYLIVADIGANEQQLELCKTIQQYSGRCKFLLIGHNDKICRRAVQIHLNLWDYFDEGEQYLSAKIADSILSLLKNVRNACSGIFVRMEMEYTLVSFDEIYYVETIKRTHNCVVHHQKGQGTIRESIRHLFQSLDSRFCICRSSTIANFSKIVRIDYQNNQLYFTDSTFCTFAASKRKLVEQFIARGQAVRTTKNYFHSRIIR